jgi:hypothetical protein
MHQFGLRILFALAVLASASGVLAAPEPKPAPAEASASDMDARTQKLKREVLELNRDLFVLEEELLFPGNTQTAVFLSMDVGKFFALDTVQVRVDNEIVSNYLYTERELEALARGGIQRLWLGNLKAGEHEVTAFFTGKGPHTRDYRRGATFKIKKETGPKYVELRIMDLANTQQPEFSVKEWE